MDKHRKKKVAPIVITVIMVIYFIAYFALMVGTMPFPLNVLFGIIPLGLGLTMIYVCRERIGEIEGGEEDDLSKY